MEEIRLKMTTQANKQLLDKGFSIDTVYSAKEGKVKRVTWFVGTVDSEKTTPQEEEIQACYFLSPADAMRVLSYDSDRRVLKAACDFYFTD